MSFYKNRLEYLKARKRYWQSQIERTDDRMSETTRKEYQRLLNYTNEQIDDEELGFLKL